MKRFMLAAVAAAAFVPGAVAAPPGQAPVGVAGTYTVTDFGTTDCAPVHGSPSLLRCDTTGFVSDYSGSLTGTSTASFTEIIDCAAGRAEGHGIETFTGSVAGFGGGTLTWAIQFSSGFDCTTAAVFHFQGRGVIRSGTGDLAHVRGQLDFTETTYQGELR
jgi:hypothetical protein